MSVFETKQGELYELKAELQSDRRERKKEALKKVVASMTVGKDVSQLFPDVISCMQTDNLEIKKLVYLYVMNYAKNQPDMAILTVSTFVRDCHDPNPLVRALAVRTMGSIRVEKIIEHLCDPLRKCLKDEDPYVRKTAAVCVAKLYDMNQQMVDDQGFLDLLRDLLSDSNGMVVANTVAALSEIAEKSPHLNIFDLNGPMINKLITAMNECTEWGQIFILDAIANYASQDEKELQSICERLTPRLAHANSAVVLSTVKVLIKFIQVMNPQNDFVNNLYRKLAPPLVTLLSAEPETQYVALRNINLIVQKRADVLKKEIKVFFVKYNDPVYVKLEKLDIMIRLASEANIVQVLAELKEYATEIDVDFVRKAVRAIGRCAIKVEQAAERCVSTLIDLIQTKVNYVVQEAIVVIKDIFRKYPNKYESIIAELCENLETLDEPDARASMIWIIGEYAERIDNADELLEGFLDSFKDENYQVQCQLLTAIVKLFLKKPSNGPQNLVTRVLGLVTQETDNPDLRDRGFIYWRLLSTDPKAAKDVVLAEKPLISEETDLLEPTLLEELLLHIGSLASVYHRPAHSFVDGRFRTWKTATHRSDPSPSVEPAVQPIVISNQVDLLSDDFMPSGGGGSAMIDFLGPPLSNSNNIPNLLDDDLSSILSLAPTTTTTNSMTTSTSGGNSLEEIFGSLTTTTTSSPFLSFQQALKLPKEIWLTAMKGKGLEVRGTFVRQQNRIVMDMEFVNRTLQPLTDFALQINHNSFGLTPAQPLTVPSPIFPNQSVSVQLPLNTNGSIMKLDPLTHLQVAIKNNIDVLYCTCSVPMHVLFVEETPLDKIAFMQTWNEIAAQNEIRSQLINSRQLTIEQIQQQFQINNVQTVNRTVIEQREMLFQTIKLTNGILVLAELTFRPGQTNVGLSLKTKVLDVAQPIVRAFESIFSAA